MYPEHPVDGARLWDYNLPATMAYQFRPRVFLPRQEIELAVGRLAAEISQDYQDKNPVLIAVLKGSFIFLADLIRRLDFPLEVEFIGLSSYGLGQESSGRIRVVHNLRCGIKGRHVLIVEDIVDTGLTTCFLLDYLAKKEPASLRVCALTSKPARRRSSVTIDYLGFTVPDRFLVGYGLDCGERFRNLPDLCFLEGDE